MPSGWIVKRKGKKGVTYRVIWKEGGKFHSAACGTSKARADLFLSKKKSDLYDGKLGLSVGADKRPFFEYAKEYIEWAGQHKAPGTVKNFDEKAVGSFSALFGQFPLPAVTPHHIEKWKAKLHDQGLGRTTVAMRLRSLRAAFQHGVKMRLLPANPCAGIRQPDSLPRARVIPNDELKRLFSAMPPRVAAAGVFILHTGVRLGELLSLDWQSVNRPKDDPWTAKVEAHGGFRTKTRRDRLIRLHPLARASMGAPRASGKVFEGLREGMMEQAMRRARAKTKIEKVRWHDLRHTFCTRYMESTGDLPGLMMQSGHSSLEAVRCYQHLTKGRLDAGMSLDFGFTPTKSLRNAKAPRSRFQPRGAIPRR